MNKLQKVHVTVCHWQEFSHSLAVLSGGHMIVTHLVKKFLLFKEPKCLLWSLEYM